MFADRQQQVKADRFNEVDQQSVKSIQPSLPQPVALPADTASVKSSKSKALSKRSRASLAPDKADENRKKILGLVSKLNDSELERVSELLQEQVQCEPEAVEEDAQSVAQSVAPSVASSRSMLTQLQRQLQEEKEARLRLEQELEQLKQLSVEI